MTRYTPQCSLRRQKLSMMVMTGLLKIIVAASPTGSLENPMKTHITVKHPTSPWSAIIPLLPLGPLGSALTIHKTGIIRTNWIKDLKTKTSTGWTCFASFTVTEQRVKKMPEIAARPTPISLLHLWHSFSRLVHCFDSSSLSFKKSDSSSSSCANVKIFSLQRSCAASAAF